MVSAVAFYKHTARHKSLLDREVADSNPGNPGAASPSFGLLQSIFFPGSFPLARGLNPEVESRAVPFQAIV